MTNMNDIKNHPGFLAFSAGNTKISDSDNKADSNDKTEGGE